MVISRGSRSFGSIGTSHWPSLEQALQRFDEPRVFRRDLGSKTANRVTLVIDQEFLEVPRHVPRLARIVRNLGEDCVQGMLIGSPHVELAEQRKRNAEVD